MRQPTDDPQFGRGAGRRERFGVGRRDLQVVVAAHDAYRDRQPGDQPLRIVGHLRQQVALQRRSEEHLQLFGVAVGRAPRPQRPQHAAGFEQQRQVGEGELCGQLPLDQPVHRQAGAAERHDGGDLRIVLRDAQGDQRAFAVADQHDFAESLPAEELRAGRGVGHEVVETDVGQA